MWLLRDELHAHQQNPAWLFSGAQQGRRHLHEPRDDHPRRSGRTGAARSEERLLHPDLVGAFVKEYRVAWNAAHSATQAAPAKAKQDLAAVEKKIAGILSAIEDGMYHPSMKAKMEQLEDRKRSLKTRAAEEPEPAILRMHPSLTEFHRQKISNLASALSDPAVRQQAAEILRGLIETIVMPPDRSAPSSHRIALSG